MPQSSTILKKNDLIQNLTQKVKDFINRPTANEIIIFARQMYSLEKSGVSLLKSILILSNNVRSKIFKNTLIDIADKLDSGQSLATAMNNHPTIFPKLMRSLVSVGEKTGKLDEVFRQISGYLEREEETRKRIKAATRYPIIVVLTILIAICIINFMVVPAFAQFFTKFNAELPLPTRILIFSSNFMLHYWFILLIIISAAIVFFMKYINTPKGDMKWSYFKLKTPLIGSIIERSLLSRFARAFALTYRTGVPLLEAIAIISKTTDNAYVAEKILSMQEHIEHGSSIAYAAKECNMFSQLVMQMIAIGEETGEIDRLLEEVADFYEHELDYDLKKLGETIEPILIVIVAGMVLILALGVFLPMWDLSKVALGG